MKSPGYLFESKKIDLTELEQYKEINEDILLEPIMKNASIILNNMYFEFRSYKLLKESKFEPEIFFLNPATPRWLRGLSVG
ncbi:MAG: hypothetical protein A2W19_09005 [Spirochaetes bacterium RBG_16_49_21]|nr:MAG: hypothetical protein A2W19_09005 [Spirochaetes bacterium RBG_16_49_21]